MRRSFCLWLAVIFVLLAAGGVPVSAVETAGARVAGANVAGCSAWAVDELTEADMLGLIPPDLAGNWQRGITRAEFAETAVFFLAAQFRVGEDELLSEWAKTGAAIDPDPFTDAGGGYVVTAYNLGVIAGRGNGIFDPDSLISREEAAKILRNTAGVCQTREIEGVGRWENSAEPGPAGIASRYADAAKISGWAAEDVLTVSRWGVMNGVSDTEFGPKGTYTREQCSVTFLRLWRNAPASREKGNVKPFRTGCEVIGDPAALLTMTAGEIEAAWGKLVLEYSEHGPGAPVYSVKNLPGVGILFVQSMFDPLPEDAVPATVLLDADYGGDWRGIAPGDDVSGLGLSDWTKVFYSGMDDCAFIRKDFDGLVLTCIVSDPVPMPEIDWDTGDYVRLDEWESAYRTAGSGTISQMRIGLSDGNKQ